MALTADAKFVIGILVATVLVIGGGAYFSSRNTPDPEGRLIPDSLTDRLVREDSATLGPDDATVTVVAFEDFQCPSCGSLHPILKAVKEKYREQSVRFVFRHFPLSQHEHAFASSVAATEAGKQGKFWEYHDKLFENQARLATDNLMSYAEELELNMDAFREALDSNAHKDIVQRDMTDGNVLGVQGTPTIFMNNREYNGQFSIDALSAAIDAVLNPPQQ